MASQGTMSDYLAHMVLDASCNDGAFTVTAHYIGFATVQVTDGMTGSTVTEPPNWTDYARTSIGTAALSAAAARAKTTTTAISIDTSATITAATVLVSWFTVDATTAGNMLWFGDTDGSSIPVQNGDAVEIASGAFDLAISATKGTPA